LMVSPIFELLMKELRQRPQISGETHDPGRPVVEGSVAELVADIESFVDTRNENARPFGPAWSAVD
jgi:hypothetical protein